MLTESSKVLFPISAIAFVMAIAYAFATGDPAGITLFLSLGFVAAFGGTALAGARQNELAPIVEADAPPPQMRPVAPVRPIGGAGWPVAGALAAGLLVVGLVAPTIVAIGGMVLAGVTLVGWMASVSNDRTGRSPNLMPIGIPVVGLFAIFALMFFMSRILLAVPESASTAIALLVAVVVLGGASVLAVRPAMSSKAIITILVVGGVVMMAGGVVAALVGQREVAHKGVAHAGPVEMVAKNIQFEEKEIALTAGGPAEIHFVNDDPAPHNVAIYTAPDASQDIYVGAVTIGPNKTINYEFQAPPAGSYFFRCDIHPNMQGTVKVA
jgi:plastocyanin